MSPVISQGHDNQGGDQQYENVAGESIYNGIPPELLIRYLDGERQSRDALAAGLERLWTRVDGLQRDLRLADQDAAMERGIGMEARIKQQAATANDISAIRRWLAALTIVLVAFAVVVIWILVDRYWIGLARTLFDALPSIAWGNP